MIAGVPYDAEIEYLESTGEQWIDTGLPLTSADTIRASFARLPTTGRYDVIFGARHNVTERNISCGIYQFSAATASLFCDFANGDDYNQYRCIAATNATGDYRVELSAGLCRIEYPGGTAIRTVRNEGEFTTSENCRIFSGGGFPNKFWSGATNFRGRFYSFSIERGGVLVRDLIPVRAGNMGTTYDRVTRRLFGSQGTGAFVRGRDIATPVMGLHRYPQIGGEA